MFSKGKIISLVLSAVFIVSTLGCNKMFQKTPPANVVQSPDLGFQTQCLAEVLPIMSRFMKGEAFPVEISATWDCFGDAITIFEKKVKGSNQNDFSGREIARFFEIYFLKNIAISDELLTEIMHLKQIFVGGSDQRISKEELLKLVAFGKQMKRISLNILPYMKIYSFNWSLTPNGNINKDIDFFEKSSEILQQGMDDISSLIAPNNKSYRFTNLLILFHGIESLYGEKWDWLTKLDQFLPLVGKIKSAVTGGDELEIAANEWKSFALFLSKSFAEYLRYYYFISKSEQLASQIGYFTNSISDYCIYLRDTVSTKPSHVFSRAELLNILLSANNLFPTMHFTEEFVTELMKIKVLFFGGTTDLWKPQDFENAANKTKSLKTLFDKNSIYLPFYFMTWKPSQLSEEEAQKFYQNAEVILKDSAALFAGLFETGYDLSDFGKFFDLLEHLATDNSFAWAGNIKKYIPAVVSYKKIILSDSTSAIQKDKWDIVLQYSARIYMQVLYYNYFINPRSVLMGAGLVSTDYFIEKVSGILNDLVGHRGPDGIITNNELIEFAVALSTAEIIPKTISTQTISSLVKLVTQRIFVDPIDRINGKKYDGLTSSHTKVILFEYHLWSDIQHAYERVFYGSGNAELSASELLALLKRLGQTQAVQEAEQLYDSAPPLVTDKSGRVMFPLAYKRYDYESASRLNLYRAVTRKVIASYAAEYERIQTYKGIYEGELTDFYSDIKSILIEMGLIADGNPNFAKNRFLDANLFMPSSDGNDLVSLREGTQIFTMIFSGLEVNSRIEKMLGEQCIIQKGERAIVDKMSVDCLIQFYAQTYMVAFETLPEMIYFLKAQSPAKFRDFVYKMIKATGWKETQDGTILRSDASLFPHVMQYLEAVMMRFDENRDGILNDHESTQAYPVYSKLIQKFSNTPIDPINKAAFFYMLKNGKVPCGVGDVLTILWQVVWNQNVGISANRDILASVFGAISDKVNGVGNQCKTATVSDLPPSFIEYIKSIVPAQERQTVIQNILNFY